MSAGLRDSTVTPGSTAPVVSVTTPAMALVPCANAVSGASTIASAVSAPRSVPIINFLLGRLPEPPAPVYAGTLTGHPKVVNSFVVPVCLCLHSTADQSWFAVGETAAIPREAIADGIRRRMTRARRERRGRFGCAHGPLELTCRGQGRGQRIERGEVARLSERHGSLGQTYGLRRTPQRVVRRGGTHPRQRYKSRRPIGPRA